MLAFITRRMRTQRSARPPLTLSPTWHLTESGAQEHSWNPSAPQVGTPFSSTPSFHRLEWEVGCQHQQNLFTPYRLPLKLLDKPPPNLNAEVVGCA